MFAHIALGLFLGGMAFRFMRRHRRWHRLGGCHGMHGLPGMHGMRGFRGPRFFGFIRDLGLSPEQVERLRPVWLSAKNAASAMRFGHAQAVHGLAAGAAAEPFDRNRLEHVAARHAEDVAQAGRDIVAAVAQVHEILTPEQREKLRAFLGRSAPTPWSGGDGPYRTAL